MPETLQKTPLFEEHCRLGARLVPYAGWEMPSQYRGISLEHRAVRERAGVFDVSHMGRLVLRGRAALSTADELVANDLSQLEVGRAAYTVCCNQTGGILDDLIIYRLEDEVVLVVCNAANHGKISSHFAAHCAAGCSYADETRATALVALQGPSSSAILRDAGLPATLEGLPSFAVGNGPVCGVPCTVARTGYTGEDGVELLCPADQARCLWTGLLAAGQRHGVQPVGLGARDTLRLEARLPLYGNEIDETTHPLEAGLGWTVKLDKKDFIGREALLEHRRRGLQRKLVGFHMLGRGVARHGYPLLDLEGRPVGFCTSGAPAPFVGKAIGLGYLPLHLTAIGTRFLVDCRGRPVEAEVIRTPFYRRAPSATQDLGGGSAPSGSR